MKQWIVNTLGFTTQRQVMPKKQELNVNTFYGLAEFSDRLSGSGQKVYTRFPLYLRQVTEGSVNQTA